MRRNVEHPVVAVAVGDTVRWIIGDPERGSGETKRIHILLKPTAPALSTNLVINTDRRTYHLELHSDQKTYMASVSWAYPEDQLIALRGQNAKAEAMAPVASGVNIGALNFRYSLQGDNPPWRPLRAFDDGSHVFIEFPKDFASSEAPPLFSVVIPVYNRAERLHQVIGQAEGVVAVVVVEAERRMQPGGAQGAGHPRSLDAFGRACRVPDTLYNLLVAGALSSAFIPVFSSYLAKEREDEAWHVA